MHRRHALTLTLSLIVRECDAQKLSSRFFPARSWKSEALAVFVFFLILPTFYTYRCISVRVRIH